MKLKSTIPALLTVSILNSLSVSAAPRSTGGGYSKPSSGGYSKPSSGGSMGKLTGQSWSGGTSGKSTSYTSAPSAPAYTPPAYKPSAPAAGSSSGGGSMNRLTSKDWNGGTTGTARPERSASIPASSTSLAATQQRQWAKLTSQNHSGALSQGPRVDSSLMGSRPDNKKQNKDGGYTSTYIRNGVTTKIVEDTHGRPTQSIVKDANGNIRTQDLRTGTVTLQRPDKSIEISKANGARKSIFKKDGITFKKYTSPDGKIYTYHRTTSEYFGRTPVDIYHPTYVVEHRPYFDSNIWIWYGQT